MLVFGLHFQVLDLGDGLVSLNSYVYLPFFGQVKGFRLGRNSHLPETLGLLPFNDFERTLHAKDFRQTIEGQVSLMLC